MADLARDELQTTTRTLMVEQDARAGEQAVTFAIVHRDVVAIDFGHAVGAAWMKRRRFALRRFVSPAEHLAAAGLIESRPRAHLTQRVEQARYAQRGELRGQYRLLPARRHERHGGQIVDFIGLHSDEYMGERCLVEQVGVMQLDSVAQVLDAAQVIGTAAANHAGDAVAFAQQQLGEITAILPRDAGDERGLIRHDCPSSPRQVGPGDSVLSRGAQWRKGSQDLAGAPGNPAASVNRLIPAAQVARQDGPVKRCGTVCGGKFPTCRLSLASWKLAATNCTTTR